MIGDVPHPRSAVHAVGRRRLTEVILEYFRPLQAEGRYVGRNVGLDAPKGGTPRGKTGLQAGSPPGFSGAQDAS